MSKKILTYYSNVCEELEGFSKKTIERRELFLIKVESNFQYEEELCSILNAENLDFSPVVIIGPCLLYTSPSPRDRQKSRMPSSA